MKLDTIEQVEEALTNYFAQLDSVGVKMKDYSKQDRALWSACMAIDSCRTDLTKFEDNLKVNPAYAFEWADNAMLAAARLKLVICLVANSCEDSAPLPFTDLAGSLKHAVDESTRSLMENRHRGASTSGASNAMDAAKREAASWFVREFSKYV